MIKQLLFLFIVLFSLCAKGQTFGPNSPSSGTNNASIGANAWTNPGNVLSNNAVYATCLTKGLTNYIATSNYGFSLPVATAVDGIQLDVEKSTLNPTVVTVLNNWTAGLTKTTSAGVNRMMLFIYSSENGNGARRLSNLTYGGQTLTKIAEGTTNSGTAFDARIEFWVLLETQLAAASNTSFVPTFSTVASLVENVEYYASAVYAGVDQVLPYTSTQVYTVSGNSPQITASPTLALTGGGFAVAAIHCGNNTTAGGAPGTGNSYLISNTFTETIDTYTGCACSASLSGMCVEIAHQSNAAAGSVAPSYTFAGTTNRQCVVYVNLECIRETDNSVRLIKGGTITGNNYAYAVGAWNTVDTYTSYGGASDLWGTTWLATDVNATNFGAVFSGSVSNGTSRIDHMRLTVTAHSTLPIELLNFSGRRQGRMNSLEWQTASERDNKLFEIEKADGFGNFEKIGTVPAIGNSKVVQSYGFSDNGPCTSSNYYRLKQIDEDGTYSYSPIIVITPLDAADDIVIYPNPSCEGIFKIAGQNTAARNFQVYSKDLKLIESLPDDERSMDLSLGHLSDGEYYLLYYAGEKQKIKKIIKQCRDN